MNKKLLITSFVFKDRKKWFLKNIKKRFGIEKSDVFIFENLGDTNQLIFTFYLCIKHDEPINIKKEFNSAIIVHKKMQTFYTINAMNSLIRLEHKLEGNNIDYRKYKIDWSKYKNKIILISDNKLEFISIKRVF